MKLYVFVLLALLICTGCATSTIQTRKQERHGIYSALPPEERNLVDQGRINVGMSKDAVYIAWGKPSEILQANLRKARPKRGFTTAADCRDTAIGLAGLSSTALTILIIMERHIWNTIITQCITSERRYSSKMRW